MNCCWKTMDMDAFDTFLKPCVYDAGKSWFVNFWSHDQIRLFNFFSISNRFLASWTQDFILGFLDSVASIPRTEVICAHVVVDARELRIEFPRQDKYYILFFHRREKERKQMSEIRDALYALVFFSVFRGDIECKISDK